MNDLILDFETRSPANLDDVGTVAYILHPQTEIMSMAYAIGDGPVHLIRRGEFATKVPKAEAFAGLRLEAHNALFEYCAWNYILAKKFGWPALYDPKQWSCTLARAAMCSFPLKLEKLSIALDLPVKKDMEGNHIMKKLSKPIDFRADGTPVYNEDPALYERMYQYNMNDVITERLAAKALPDLPPEERKIWELDLLINLRGVKLDVDLAAKARDLAAHFTEKLNGPLKDMTGGFIDKASQVAALISWLEARGIEVPVHEVKNKETGELEMKKSLGKQSLAELLTRKDLPQTVRDVLEIRREVGKSSTSKYETMVNMAIPRDHRARGTLQYHAAATGRWAGRKLQPQNLPQGTLTDEEIETAIPAIRQGNPDLIEMVYDKPMAVLSSCIRACIIPENGKKFVSGDYSAIEARMVFWLVNDPFALAKYQMGVDLYKDMAAFVYKKDVKDIDKHERQLGKKIILGCGYGMGHKRFRGSCMEDQFSPFDPGEELAQAAVKGYREKYKTVRDEWYKVEDAAVLAVRNPGRRYTCCGDKVTFGMSGDRRFLICRLPSGRGIRYYMPKVKTEETKIGIKDVLYVMSENPRTKRWQLMSTYGGALFENITQGTARDVMAHGMLKCEAAGFPVVLTVHDELLSEVPDSPAFSKDKFLGLMCELPPWAKGFPVVAEGWEGYRYRK